MRPDIFRKTFVLILTVSFLYGCFPYWGRGRINPPDAPLPFVDSTTGERVQEVLIIPKFDSHTGISYGAGHGGRMTEYSYLDMPFIYRADDRFPMKEPRKFGIMWGLGWAWTGTGSSLHNLVVVAPGYKAQCVMPYPISTAKNQYALISLSRVEAIAELRKILALLEQEKLSVNDQKNWILSNDQSVDFCWGIGQTLAIAFNPEEKRLIKEFILENLKQLSKE